MTNSANDHRIKKIWSSISRLFATGVGDVIADYK
jgi:hypothetical protein